MSSHQIAIIGLGPAGIFTLAALPESSLPTTLVIERGCIGGDIAGHYGSVLANVSKADIVKTLRTLPKWAEGTFPELDSYHDAQSPPLAIVGKILRRLIVPDLQKVQFHTCELKTLTNNAGMWHLTTTTGEFDVAKVVLCIGAVPKTLNLPTPTIPLSVAFTPDIAHFVNPQNPIVVFGTSHSGVLVLKSLHTLGCTQVYAVYKGDVPFRIATDTITEGPFSERSSEKGLPLWERSSERGLRQEAAAIANEIQTKAWGESTPTLISYNDFGTLYRLVQKAQAVIYAIGFEPRRLGPQDAPNLYHVGYCNPKALRLDIGFGVFIQTAQAILVQLLSPPAP